MFKVLLFTFALGGPKNDYDYVQRYNDSLLIYNTYQSQIKILKALRQTDLQTWFNREAYDESLTVCAKLRLKKFNHQSYNPSETYERKGMGIAYGYPAPKGNDGQQIAEGFTKTTDPKLRYAVLDKQTHFQLSKNLGRIVPYVERLIFDKGRLLYIEKLNPVTLEKL